MNIKIHLHIMPWEIDHALLVVDKLKKSIYHIDPQDTIYIDTALNLSSGVINCAILSEISSGVKGLYN